MIYLVRHGQTLQNRAGLLQGRSDFPLNEMGREQARRVGAFFREQGVRFDAVYTSPLRRAVGWICGRLRRRSWPFFGTL